MAALFTMAGLGTASPITKPMKTAIAAMVSIMGFGFALGFAPLSYVVTTELPALRLRDKTLFLGFITNVVVK